MLLDAIIMLGSNEGDRVQNILTATALVTRNVGQVSGMSPVYESAPWGKASQPWYYNRALHVRTALGAHQLLAACLKVENDMGRQRHEKWGPRLIDIDLIYYSDAVLSGNGLTVPHPHIAKRKFVLVCLAALGTVLKHPVTGLSSVEMLEACKDKLEVKRLSPQPL